MGNGSPDLDLGWVTDVYHLVEEKVPLGRFVAPAVLTLGVLWLGWFTLRHVADDIAAPLTRSIGGTGLPSFSMSSVLTLAVTLVLVGSVYVLFTRRLRTWQRNVMESLHDYLSPQLETVESRLKVIEKNLRIGPQRVSYSGDDQDDVIGLLTKRVFALEDHTDISGLKAMLTERIMEGSFGPMIISARYGIADTPHKSADVTDVVSSFKKNGRIEVWVNNDTMGVGNIYAGTPKTLYVRYSEGGISRSVEVPETHKLSIPELLTLKELAGGKT
jgi:hypothetical protein